MWFKRKNISTIIRQIKETGYIIIDEYSVMGQKMFGWIDRRLRPVSGLMDTLFGGFPIILVGDIAQLPPVLDKPLYCLVSENQMAMMGFFALRNIDHVMKLEQNLMTLLAADQQEFKELLLRLG